MAFLTINEVEMPAPSEMKVELVNVGSDEQRSASGRLVCDRVAVKRKLKLEWTALSGDDLRKLLSSADGFFAAEYPDPLTGAMRESTFYASTCRTKVLKVNSDGAVWSDVSMEWTEQ